MNGAGLTERVTALLRTALDAASGPAQRLPLEDALRRLDEPLRIAIAGKVKAGKSTLLNALVGEELAPTDAGECTRLVTWYRDGHTYRVLAHLRTGDEVQRPFQRRDGAIEIDLGGLGPEEIDHLEVWWPSARLRHHALIDTPGIASIATDVSARTVEALSAEEGPPTADAVVYLLRHLHSTDVRFLESFLDDEVGRSTPVNAIGVLSRADEIGAARLSAMETAERVAARYRSEPRVRRLCSTVVPVAGLLAQGASTLREDEFAALSAVAGLPGREAAELLLTADRFAGADRMEQLPAELRMRLLQRFGLFGVRLSDRLIRTGAVTSATQLADHMLRHSGLESLRTAIDARFGERSRALKARSALLVVRDLLRDPAWRPGPLLAELERIEAGAHELTEIRLLNQLFSGLLAGGGELDEEMARLLGAEGDALHQRLGVPDDTTRRDLRAAAEEALRRWRRTVAHPRYDKAYREAARGVVRSVEGMLVQLSAAASGFEAAAEADAPG